MSAPGQTFSKLEALGNDFVLLDQRDGRADPQPEQVRALADRRTGIGCDQLLILQPAAAAGTDCAVSIYNCDGSPARQCGNGMRAIGLWLHQENPDRRDFLLATAAGAVAVRVADEQRIQVDMGQPDFDSDAAGFAPTSPASELAAGVPGVLGAGTVSMGNPHLVVLLADPPTSELLEQHGRRLGSDVRFSDGVNVSFVHSAAPDRLSLRVFERGAGATRACGSAACASAAWLLHLGRVHGPVRVDQPGGRLVIDWRGPGQPLRMTGSARRVFDGTLR